MIRGLLIATLLAGCGAATTTEPSTSARTESPSDVSESPSAEPSAAATMTRDEFRSHVRTAITELNDQVEGIQLAVGEPAPEIGTQLAALGLLTWAADETEWVRENLPAECYREAWEKYGEAVDLYQSAAEAFGDASDDFDRALSDGTTLAEEGQRALEEAGSLTGSAAC